MSGIRIVTIHRTLQKLMSGVDWVGLVVASVMVGLPLVMWPWAAVPFEVPRVVVVEVGVWVAVMATLVWQMRGGKANRLDRGLMWGLVAWWVWAGASGLMGGDVTRSWWGNYYRRDGLMTALSLYGLALVVGLAWRRKWYKWCKQGVMTGMGIVSGLAIVEAITGGWGAMKPWDGAVGATFGQPNFLAGYLLVALPFGLGAMMEGDGRGRWWRIGTVTVAVVAVLLSRSMVGVVGVGLLPVVWWMSGKLKGKKLMAGLVGLWLVAMVGQGVWVAQMDKYAPDSRRRIVTKLLMAWEKRPIVGWGWANVDKAFEAVVWPLPYFHDVYVDKAHGQMLEVLVTTGLVGVVLYGWVVMRLGWNLVREMETLRLSGTSHSTRRAQAFGTRAQAIRGDKVALKSLATLSSEGIRVLVVVWWMYLFHSQTNVMSIAEEVVFWMVMGVGMMYVDAG